MNTRRNASAAFLRFAVAHVGQLACERSLARASALAYGAVPRC
jgi:hypothetical protein